MTLFANRALTALAAFVLSFGSISAIFTVPSAEARGGANQVELA